MNWKKKRGTLKAKKQDKKQEKINNGTTWKQLYSNLGFAYKFIWNENKLLFLIRIPYIFIQTLKTVIPIFFVREILNELAMRQNIKKVLLWAGIMALSAFVLYILSSLLSMWDSREFTKLRFRASELLADSIMNMSYETVENSEIQDYIWLAKYNNFDTIYKLTMETIGSIVTLFGIGTVVFSLNPIMLAVIVITCISGYMIDKYSRKLSTKHDEEFTAANRQNYYLTGLMEFPEQGMDIRTNNLEEWISNRAEKSWWQEIFPIELSFTKKMQSLQNASGIIVLVQNLFIYAFLVFEIVNKSLTVGDFSMYLTAANTFSSYLLNITSKYSDLMLQTASYLNNYRRCIKMAEKQKANGGHNHIEIPKNAEIEFRDVSFKYPQTERMILEHINIKIKRGETLSIVGVNGAGKTTFVKLLCRFYEPTEGEIFINEIPARDIPLDEYYDFLAVVFQDFTIFQFKMYENIVMDTEYDKRKLDDAIHRSGLDKRVDTLPKGVDTYLYKLFDPDGIELSGGEGQKVAIARAIYRNTPIVIFDEPTSALDPIAEYDIYRNFHDLAENRTAIYISHRLSSTRFTDNIAVFANGTIVEYGTHDELMKIKDGLYKDMFSTQAQYYV